MIRRAPLVSICTPAYNAGKYILSAINSIQSQTYSNWELLIVNDGSTDNTSSLLAELDEPRIRVLNQANRGQCAAANAALNESKGEYIKFFDADDLLHPRMLELQVARINAQEASIASAEWGRFYGNDVQSFSPNRQSVWRDMEATDWLVESWMDARPMMQCALWLIPRKILERTGGWDERLSLINDFEFFARVLCASENVLFTPNCPLYYRSGVPGSLSGSKGRTAAESAYNSLSWGVEHLLAKRDDRLAKLACANVFQNFLYTNYPSHMDLCLAAEKRAASLSRATVMPAGGRFFHAARRVMGWRLARRLENRCRPLLNLVHRSKNHPI